MCLDCEGLGAAVEAGMGLNITHPSDISYYYNLRFKLQQRISAQDHY